MFKGCVWTLFIYPQIFQYSLIMIKKVYTKIHEDKKISWMGEDLRIIHNYKHNLELKY